MADWLIRKAVSSDESQIIACINDAYAPYKKFIADLPPVADGIGNDIEHNHVWVVEFAGGIVGVLVLISWPPVAKLANLAVDPDQGGKGIGKALISHAEQCAQDLRCSQLDLNTHSEMTGNIRLYEKLGWREIARDDRTVSMSKDI